MKFGHLRSLQTHVRRHPPPVSRRTGASRLPPYNLHIREASASHSITGCSAQLTQRTIITPPHTLPGTHCSVHSAPAPQASGGPRPHPALWSYLAVCLAFMSLVLARPGTAQTVAEVQVTPETMTLGVGQKQ